MMEKEKQGFNLREKFVIIICTFLIKMAKPWEYDHQFKEFWNEVKDTLK